MDAPSLVARRWALNGTWSTRSRLAFQRAGGATKHLMHIIDVYNDSCRTSVTLLNDLITKKASYSHDNAPTTLRQHRLLGGHRNRTVHNNRIFIQPAAQYVTLPSIKEPQLTASQNPNRPKTTRRATT